ncbi:hypothetical protein JQC91_05720 [Jannaschia sp. Os4]|uniref:hypothetical protein n=1 Tax=Jannaschia sp. Os4 TaxID=2807617 RepID=UPI00193973B8|nr:hypothetical protein [Jannaschia sp. Os4]MBM2575799.1 hypothetical protein [Jannaschia sp. Os4]
MMRICLLWIVGVVLGLGACRAEPEAIRYEIVAADRWPVVVFVRDVSAPFAPFGDLPVVRSGGWDTRQGSVPLRPRGPVDGSVTFDLLWHEVATGQAYAATIAVEPRDLHRNPVGDEAFGTLLLRVGAHGYLDAMTYEDSYPPAPDPPPGTRLAQTCGEAVPVEDDRILALLGWALAEAPARDALLRQGEPQVGCGAR